METCSVCRRRPAFYLREYSGHRLCTLCIERTLAKTVKRRVNSTHLLSPGDTIAVPLYRYDPSGGLSLARLLSIVEARYGSRILILAPRGGGYEEHVSRVAEDASHRVDAEVVWVEPLKPRVDRLVHCMRLERSWALRAAAEAGARVVVDSVNRSQALLAAMDALFDARVEGVSEALPVVPSEPPVIHGFYDVEAETVAAYAYSRGLVAGPSCRARSASKRVFLSVARGRPELAFSGYKVLEKLASRAEDLAGGRCRLCGGLGGPVCSYCREAGALSGGYSEPPPG